MDPTFYFTAECGFYAALRLQQAVTFSGRTVLDDTPPLDDTPGRPLYELRLAEETVGKTIRSLPTLKHSSGRSLDARPSTPDAGWPPARVKTGKKPRSSNAHNRV